MTEDTLEFEGRTYAGGGASDPRVLNWMNGLPAPAAKQITPTNFLDFPQIRWSLSHMREILPTVNVRRGDGPRVGLGTARDADNKAFDGFTFTDINNRTRRWDDALVDTYTDGIIVLHRGRVLYERYFGALTAELPHSCFSITKSYAGALAMQFVHEGVLDGSKKVPYYLPELRGTAWEEATLRQVMDMETGLEYSETYDDQRSGVWAYSRAFGMRPRTSDYDGPQTMCDYLRTVSTAGRHGEAFAYKTVNTEVMAWVMARATGHSFEQLLHEHFWAPLGCEEDGSVNIDKAGMAMAGGGLSVTLRDLARFGELMRCEGEWDGKQLLPSAVVHEVQHGGDPARFAKAGLPLCSGYSYRSMWWVSHNELDTFEARGIHGQRLYVAPKAEMVIARLASHPIAASAANEPITGPQFLALGRMLRE